MDDNDAYLVTYKINHGLIFLKMKRSKKQITMPLRSVSGILIDSTMPMMRVIMYANNTKYLLYESDEKDNIRAFHRKLIKELEWRIS